MIDRDYLTRLYPVFTVSPPETRDNPRSTLASFGSRNEEKALFTKALMDLARE